MDYSIQISGFLFSFSSLACNYPPIVLHIDGPCLNFMISSSKRLIIGCIAVFLITKISCLYMLPLWLMLLYLRPFICFYTCLFLCHFWTYVLCHCTLRHRVIHILPRACSVCVDLSCYTFHARVNNIHMLIMLLDVDSEIKTNFI
jgi:hypothetical protein